MKDGCQWAFVRAHPPCYLAPVIIRETAMQATIIAVGSELLCGQITNRNAAWISARLFALGVATRRHVTVDDVETEIVGALTEAEAAGDLMFITGGLGPTSDDLTRNAVAAWAQQELTWHEPSWTRIVGFFSKLARTTPESNKQQCFFPRGAAVLENVAGTANAFAMTVRGKLLWVLPGPPREVEAVWEPHVFPVVKELIPAAERRIYKMWRTIGRGESHVAEQIEEIIKGKGLDVAYRAHPPFVETKLRITTSELGAHGALIGTIDDALKPWLFEVDDENSAAVFVRLLEARGKRVRIVDSVTRGHLSEALMPLWKGTDLAFTTDWGLAGTPAAKPAPGELVLTVGPGRTPETWMAGAATSDGDAEIELPNAFKGEAMRARNEKAIAALVMKRWPELMARLP